MYYFLPPLPFSQFQLSAKSGKNTLLFRYLPKQSAFTHSSGFNKNLIHNPQCVFVCVVRGGAYVDQVMADTQAAMQRAVIKVPWSK